MLPSNPNISHSLVFTEDEFSFNWIPMVITFNIIGRIGISSSFMTLYLYSSEIYPTAIRSQALAVCGAFGTLANIVSPYSRVLVSITETTSMTIEAA